MKKTLFILILALIGANSFAQSAYDALRFSQNNYVGTARSVGMGNAMTAVGGDLGSLTFNPAGSAVAGYSQMTFTPSINISSCSDQGTALSGQSQPYSFGDDNTTGHTRFTFPNCGVVMNFDNHRSSGLKSFSIGFVGNATNNFLGDVSASGSNSNTSFMGETAVEGTGFESSVLNNTDAYYNSNASWKSIVGYQSGMIATYGGKTNQYVGATEKINSDGTISLADVINQRYGRLTTGYKYDFLMNFGGNVSDVFYFGINIGITSLDYNDDEYTKESAVDPSRFGIQFDDNSTVYFNDMRYRYSYNAQADGVYAKFGFIATPYKGLRFGAAIQTPTSLDVDEKWSMDGETHFSDSKYDANASSPEGNYSYNLRTPYRVNAGIAYTFGQYGMISADYEMCDYSTMKFNVKGSNDNSEFSSVNNDIKNLMGTSHMLRIGGELKPVPEFAIRVGYDMTTNPQKYESASGQMKYLTSKYESTSFGVGYSSEGSFFADLACRINFMPDEYIYPYSDYIKDANNNVTVYSPEIKNQMNLWDVVATVGFRF